MSQSGIAAIPQPEVARGREQARAATHPAPVVPPPAPRPPKLPPGSPYAVGGRTDDVLTGLYGLPPTSTNGEVSGCRMARTPLSLPGGRRLPPEPCQEAAQFVADLGYSGAGMPVCVTHAHQLWSTHEKRPGLEPLTLHPLRFGVEFGIPAQYLGPHHDAYAAGPDYRGGGGFRRGW